METVGKVAFSGGGTGLSDVNIIQLCDAIRELSEQIQALQRISREESERLKKYMDEGKPLVFNLITSGTIKGEIIWVGGQSIGIQTETGHNFMLYKHAIAFIHEPLSERIM